MIGMILVTHGRLAEEFKLAVEHVLGAQEAFEAVCIAAHDDITGKRLEILDKLHAVKGEKGAVIFTDMFGGTPSNLAISVMQEEGVEVIAGVNLPMLIKFSSLRARESLEKASLEAQEAGRKYINVASALLGGARTAESGKRG